MLSHANLIANVAGTVINFSFSSSDMWVDFFILSPLILKKFIFSTYSHFILQIGSYISYLPLAHIYERSYQVLIAHFGTAVGFYQGVWP